MECGIDFLDAFARFIETGLTASQPDRTWMESAMTQGAGQGQRNCLVGIQAAGAGCDRDHFLDSISEQGGSWTRPWIN